MHTARVDGIAKVGQWTQPAIDGEPRENAQHREQSRFQQYKSQNHPVFQRAPRGGRLRNDNEDGLGFAVKPARLRGETDGLTLVFGIPVNRLAWRKL